MSIDYVNVTAIPIEKHHKLNLQRDTHWGPAKKASPLSKQIFNNICLQLTHLKTETHSMND